MTEELPSALRKPLCGLDLPPLCDRIKTPTASRGGSIRLIGQSEGPRLATIRGAGHLVTMTNSREVNDFLEKIEERFCGTIAR